MKVETKKPSVDHLTCYHCGERCEKEAVSFDNKPFCCEGCKLVYDLLKENDLCTYYNIHENAGISPNKSIYKGKYDYLNSEKVQAQLIQFKDGNNAHITFFIPGIHCSSCIWLLENMHKLHPGITSSKVNFLKKEATLWFDDSLIRLSEIAELLCNIGYEPNINQNDLERKVKKKTGANELLKIGIAGFCFGNIMMLSFPEYFSVGNYYDQTNLPHFFGYLNLLLSLPVFLYSSSGFLISAWKSVKYKYLTIDAPIALAIVVTFLRSVYEILSHTGAGYLDSMSGIVFFMLLGRFFQHKTYETLSFERDYKSYFPIGVTVKKENGSEINQSATELKKGDRIIIRNNEIIPADAVLVSEQTYIDYSFITGESSAVTKKKGELIYAGGRQLGGAIELTVMKETSQSYLTQLWNQDENVVRKEKEKTYIDAINKYFTLSVLMISFSSAIYWLINDPTKTLNALTAVLIVACPCGLLLTTTFAHGNVLRILGRNKFHLKNTSVINKLAYADTLVFDKTGTITQGSDVTFIGSLLNPEESQLVASLSHQSTHPLSRKINSELFCENYAEVKKFEEIPGQGIKGIINGHLVSLGSEYFITGEHTTVFSLAPRVFLMIDGEIMGYFSFKNKYRNGIENLMHSLSQQYKIVVLSGDNDSERKKLEEIFGKNATLLFHQKPEEKKFYIKRLQESGRKVVMIGDGLNDAGALKQSDVGIAVSDNTGVFFPACDAMLDGSSICLLPEFISLSKYTKKVIILTFTLSLLYNIIGLSYAISGTLLPVIAAILMPISSLTIVLLSTISTTLIAKSIKL